MIPQEEVIEKLRKMPISNIDEAINFLYKKEGAKEVIPVDWKWEVRFEQGDNFKFNSDEALIEWCIEQRDAYWSEEENA